MPAWDQHAAIKMDHVRLTILRLSITLTCATFTRVCYVVPWEGHVGLLILVCAVRHFVGLLALDHYRKWNQLDVTRAGVRYKNLEFNGLGS